MADLACRIDCALLQHRLDVSVERGAYGSLVDDVDSVLLVKSDDGFRFRSSSSLGDLDSFLDDDSGVLLVRRRSDGREESEIDGAACQSLEIVVVKG